MKRKEIIMILSIVAILIILGTLLLFFQSSPPASIVFKPSEAGPINSESDANQAGSEISTDINSTFSAIDDIKNILG